MTRILTVLGLTAAWVVLWRDLSFANVAGGLLAAVASVAVLGAPRADAGSVNLVGLARFVLLVLKDTVLSTISVASEVLTPTDYTDELTATIDLPAGNEKHLLALTLAVTLTPGTAVIDSDPSVPNLTIHLLHADKLDETIEHVQTLANAAGAAWPDAHIAVDTEEASP